MSQQQTQTHGQSIELEDVYVVCMPDALTRRLVRKKASEGLRERFAVSPNPRAVPSQTSPDSTYSEEALPQALPQGKSVELALHSLKRKTVLLQRALNVEQRRLIGARADLLVKLTSDVLQRRPDRNISMAHSKGVQSRIRADGTIDYDTDEAVSTTLPVDIQDHRNGNGYRHARSDTNRSELAQLGPAGNIVRQAMRQRVEAKLATAYEAAQEESGLDTKTWNLTGHSVISDEDFIHLTDQLRALEAEQQDGEKEDEQDEEERRAYWS